jgi:serine/threonine protein kinase/formylglycine-generating enzyme required for sulfatase activity
MDTKSDCLAPTLLVEFLSGNVPEPRLSELAKHLEQCESCQKSARSLPVNDTILETLRNGNREDDLMVSPLSASLIDRIKQLPNIETKTGLQNTEAYETDDSAGSQELMSFLDAPQQTGDLGQLGRYRVFKVLGRGGMGAVFLAEDSKLGRQVALKMILPKIASIPAARERFLREAKAAAGLKNDHIVTIYQVDEFKDVPFLAMELLQGESLERLMLEGRQFSSTETISIARDVARGLAHAHEKGVVHRDIKPGNLWLEDIADGGMRVKILDFGLAQAKSDDVHLTQFGAIVGTPAFMAPEQARGDRAVDARADLFSLGCVLYLLSTGEVPFKADTTVGTLMALATAHPVPPIQRNGKVPAELSRLIMQLLEKDPAQRPQSGRDVIERLGQVERSIQPTIASMGILGETLPGFSTPSLHSPRLELSSQTNPKPEPLRRSGGRRIIIAIGMILVTFALIAAGVFFWPTPYGSIVRIESNDPSIQLAFQGGELKVTGAYDDPVILMPGKVDLKVKRIQPDGKAFEFETDKLVVRKGDQIALKIEVLDGEVQIVQEGKGMIDAKPLMPGAEQLARLVDAMKRANPSFDGAMTPVFDDDRLVSLDFKTDFVTDLSPLRRLKYLRNLQMLGNFSRDSGLVDISPIEGLPLTRLDLTGNRRLADILPMKGMHLQELFLTDCSVVDLTPIAGMPLQILWTWNWPGSDLSPLKGMPLKELNIGGNGNAMDLTPLSGAPLESICFNLSKVSDIAPLRGMPLKKLYCENTLVHDLTPIKDTKLTEFIGGGTRISDFSVLRDMPLTWAKFDIVPKRDLEMLRDIKTLDRINDQRAKDFLKELSEEVSPPPVSPAFTSTIGMDFMKVPRGKAWLARKVSDNEASFDQETEFKDDFYLGMYEVTQEQWVKVMGSNPSFFNRNAEGAEAVKALSDEVLRRLPVHGVSWTDCQDFLKKINETDSTPGWVYRLPTLAERQYACLGGPMKDRSQALFAFCTQTRTHVLTVDDANVQHPQGWNRPCRVGTFAPNPLGLYDMHGNVWEWCDDAASWREERTRFIHGGGWNEPSDESRASNIKYPTEPWKYYDLGFRIARVPKS